MSERLVHPSSVIEISPVAGDSKVLKLSSGYCVKPLSQPVSINKTIKVIKKSEKRFDRVFFMYFLLLFVLEFF